MAKDNMFNLSRIGAKYSIVCILFSLCVLFIYAPSCNADALEKTLDEIVQDFERHIGNVAGEKKYYVVVRSFIDSQTKKPKKISTEIEDTLVDKIIERFSDKKKLLCLKGSVLKRLKKKSLLRPMRSTLNQVYWTGNLVKNLELVFLLRDPFSK